MIDRIERHTIEKNQVLIGSSTTDIQSCGTFRTGLHPGQELDSFKHIHFASDGRNTLDLRNRHFDGGHLNRLGAGNRMSRLDHHFTEHRSGNQFHFHQRIGRQPKSFRQRAVVAHISRLELHGVRRYRQRIKAIHVGHCSDAGTHVLHSSSDETLACLHIRYIAAHGGLFGHQRERQDEHQKNRKASHWAGESRFVF